MSPAERKNRLLEQEYQSCTTNEESFKKGQSISQGDFLLQGQTVGVHVNMDDGQIAWSINNKIQAETGLPEIFRGAERIYAIVEECR